jgi:3'-5' exoribonuclease
VKTVYINELQQGHDLKNEPFLLQDLVRRTTKDGRPYLLCTLSDRTGQVNSVFWDLPDDVDGWIRPGLVILVSGRVASYKDALQVNATDMNPYRNPDMSEFLPSSSRSQNEMIDELRRQIRSLARPWQDLVAAVLLEEDFLPRFASAPAARTMHHGYIGGLIEHTLSMTNLARHLARHYPYVNEDLLVAGTLLHDAGKAIEYTTEPAFAFSDDGRLVGHIVRAVVLVEKAADKIAGLSADQLRQLVHLIIAHHGTNEWGSPIVPKTIEAILLHQIDLLDSRVQGFFDHLRSETSDGLWTSRPSYMFNTELRRPPGFDSRGDG